MSAEGVRLYVCRAESLDARINLATEACLTRGVGEGEIILFLWQNERTAVIGRNQTARAEVALSRLFADGGRVLRRLSGGGAVYHDTGNLNYSFIYRASFIGEPNADNSTAAVRHAKNAPGASADPIISVVLPALSSLGIAAVPSGRNDIAVPITSRDSYIIPQNSTDSAPDTQEAPGGGIGVPSQDLMKISGGGTGVPSQDLMKISGGALFDLGSGGGVCRHGTLLVAADLDAMSRYLTPSRAKLDCRGIASVRARVTNLNRILPGLTTASVADALSGAAAAKWGMPRTISPAAVAASADFAAELERFSSDGWNLSDLCDLTDEWSVRYSGGTLTLSLSVSGGIIHEARLSTDALDTHRLTPVCAAVGAALGGVMFDPRRMAEAVAGSLPPDNADIGAPLISMIRDNF